MFNELLPNLMVEDVDATVAWYERTLGAELANEMRDDEDARTWATIDLGQAQLMSQRRDSLEAEVPQLEGAPIGGSMTLYAHQDVESLAERVAGVPRVLELRTTDYGIREFAIEDHDGYVLWFAEIVGDPSAA